MRNFIGWSLTIVFVGLVALLSWTNYTHERNTRIEIFRAGVAYGINSSVRSDTISHMVGIVGWGYVEDKTVRNVLVKPPTDAEIDSILKVRFREGR